MERLEKMSFQTYKILERRFLYETKIFVRETRPTVKYSSYLEAFGYTPTLNNYYYSLVTNVTMVITVSFERTDISYIIIP